MKAKNIDLAASIITHLQAAGYRIHEGEADDRPDLGMNAHWFTWAADGMSSYEVGDGQPSAAAAWNDAMAHWFKNSSVPLHLAASVEAAPAALDARDLATVLCALRCYQQVKGQCGGDIPDDLEDIRSDGGKLEPLDMDEVDALCERLNAEPGAPLAKPEAPTGHAALIDSLDAYCKAQGLPHMSADELSLRIGNTPEQLRWLADYCNRWDRWTEFRRDLNEAMRCVCQAEGWFLFNENSEIQHDDEAGTFMQDGDADAYVRRMAAAGSPVHAYALELLADAQG